MGNGMPVNYLEETDAMFAEMMSRLEAEGPPPPKLSWLEETDAMFAEMESEIHRLENPPAEPLQPPPVEPLQPPPQEAAPPEFPQAPADFQSAQMSQGDWLKQGQAEPEQPYSFLDPEDMRDLVSLRNITQEFNKPRQTKAEKAKLTEQGKALRRRLTRMGYSGEYLADIESGRAGILTSPSPQAVQEPPSEGPAPGSLAAIVREHLAEEKKRKYEELRKDDPETGAEAYQQYVDDYKKNDPHGTLDSLFSPQGAESRRFAAWLAKSLEGSEKEDEYKKLMRTGSNIEISRQLRDSAFTGLIEGTAQSLKAGATFLNWAVRTAGDFGVPFTEPLEKVTKAAAKHYGETAKEVRELYPLLALEEMTNPDGSFNARALINPFSMARTLSKLVPDMAFMAASGGVGSSTKVWQTLSKTYGASWVINFGHARDALEEEGYDERLADLSAGFTATLSSLLDIGPFGLYFRKGTGASKFVSGKVGNMVTRFIRSAAKGKAGQMTAASFVEGLTEGLQEIVESLSRAVFLDDEEAFDGLWARVRESFILGAFMGPVADVVIQKALRQPPNIDALLKAIKDPSRGNMEDATGVPIATRQKREEAAKKIQEAINQTVEQLPDAEPEAPEVAGPQPEPPTEPVEPAQAPPEAQIAPEAPQAVQEPPVGPVQQPWEMTREEMDVAAFHTDLETGETKNWRQVYEDAIERGEELDLDAPVDAAMAWGVSENPAGVFLTKGTTPVIPFSGDALRLYREGKEAESQGRRRDGYRLRKEAKQLAYDQFQKERTSPGGDDDADDVEEAQIAPEPPVEKDLEQLSSQVGAELTLAQPETEAEQDAVAFGKERGLDVQFFEGDTGTRGGSMEGGRRVFVKKGLEENTFWGVVGHEVAHGTGIDRRLNIPAEILTEARKRRYEKGSKRYQEIMDADPALARREGIAQIIQDVMSDPKFRARLKAEKPTVWEKIRDAVLQVVGKFTPASEVELAVLQELRDSVVAPPAKPAKSKGLKEKPPVGPEPPHLPESKGRKLPPLPIPKSKGRKLPPLPKSQEVRPEVRPTEPVKEATTQPYKVPVEKDAKEIQERTQPRPGDEKDEKGNRAQVSEGFQDAVEGRPYNKRVSEEWLQKVREKGVSVAPIGKGDSVEILIISTSGRKTAPAVLEKVGNEWHILAKDRRGDRHTYYRATTREEAVEMAPHVLLPEYVHWADHLPRTELAKQQVSTRMYQEGRRLGEIYKAGLQGLPAPKGTDFYPAPKKAYNLGKRRRLESELTATPTVKKQPAKTTPVVPPPVPVRVAPPRRKTPPPLPKSKGLKAKGKEPSTKEPWEMTRKEYDSSRSRKRGILFNIDENYRTKHEEWDQGYYAPDTPIGNIIQRAPDAMVGIVTHELMHHELYGKLGEFIEAGTPRHKKLVKAIKSLTGIRFWTSETKRAERLGGARPKHVFEDTGEIERAALQAWIQSDIAKKKIRKADPELAQVLESIDATDLVPHKFQVEAAIKEGKPVPQEVRDEYPDLKSKEKKAKPKAAVPTETRMPKKGTKKYKELLEHAAALREQEAERLNDQHRAGEDKRQLFRELVAIVKGDSNRTWWASVKKAEDAAEVHRLDVLAQIVRDNPHFMELLPGREPGEGGDISDDVFQLLKRGINQFRTITKAEIKTKLGKPEDWLPDALAEETVGRETAAEAATREADEAYQNAMREGIEGEFGGLPIGRKQRKRSDDIPKHIWAPSEEIERALQPEHAGRNPGRLRRFIDFVSGLPDEIAMSTRAQKYIPDTPEFASANALFRKLKALRAAVSDQVYRTLAGITDSIGGPDQFYLFERSIIMDNLLASVTRDEAEPRRFAFESVEQIRKYKEDLDKMVAGTPAVKRAKEHRRKVVVQIAEELVKHKLLPPEALDRAETYFHQMVEVDRAAREIIVRGKRGKRVARPVKRAFQSKRTVGPEELSTDLDYSTRYLDAEARFMTDALEEIGKAKWLEQLDGLYGKMEEMKQLAKDHDDDSRTWQDEVNDELNLTTWVPKEQNVFYKAFTVPDKLLRAFEKGLIDELQLSPDQLQEVLALKGPDRKYVLPQEIADQLDSMERPGDKGWLSEINEYVVRQWKEFILLRPDRFAAYMLRNFSSDVDVVIAGHSGILLYLPEARKVLDRRLLPHPDVKRARESAVIGSGVTSVEIDKLSQVPDFSRLDPTTPQDNLIVRYFDWAKEVNEDRENFLRFAAYLYFKDHLNNGTLTSYGGSKKKIIDTVHRELGVEEAAAQLSRELLGDYDNLSVIGDALRKKGIFPFWAWKEINAVRFTRMIPNLYKSGQKGRATVVASVYGGLAVLGLGKLYLGAWLWNHLFFPDEEDELSDRDSAAMHMIFGSDPMGTILLRNIGALGDILQWFGMNTLIHLAPKYLDGQLSGKDLVGEVVKDPWNVLVSGLHPVGKGAAEIAMGSSSYPDVFNMRSADRLALASDVVGARDVALALRGFFTQSGEGVRPGYWQRLIGYSEHDLNAMHEIHDARRNFLKIKRPWQVPAKFGASPIKVMRDAAHAANYDRFVKARKVYLKKGLTFKQFAKGLEFIDPVSNRLNEKLEKEFVEEFLSDDQRSKLEKARNYAQKLELTMWWWWRKAAKKGPADELEATNKAIAKTVGNKVKALVRGKPTKRTETMTRIEAVEKWRNEKAAAEAWLKGRGLTYEEVSKAYKASLPRAGTKKQRDARNEKMRRAGSKIKALYPKPR